VQLAQPAKTANLLKSQETLDFLAGCNDMQTAKKRLMAANLAAVSAKACSCFPRQAEKLAEV
jgi:hypothetical protein